jgi:integrase
MKVEQLVPLSARAAEAIRAQQTHLRHQRPGVVPPRLFPSPYCNPDGVRAFSYATFRARLARWEDAIGLHDEAGQPVRVTAHQFRHTLGTRLINDGVPQHVVQKLLGHASPQMTARYATIHDTTVRAAFDDYQRRRVDIKVTGSASTPTRRPLTPSGSNTTSPASPPACPTATAVGRHSRTARTPTPV